MRPPIIIRLKDFMAANDKYGPVLLRFVRSFTQDEELIRQIVETALWELLSEGLDHSDPPLPMFRILQFTRDLALRQLRSDPLYDPWSPWIQQPLFFTFPASLSALHQELFNRLYFRGLSEAALAQRFHLDPAKVHQKIRETAYNLHRPKKDLK